MLSRNVVKAIQRTSVRRLVTDTKILASSVYMDPKKTKDPAVSTTPRNITKEQRAALEAAIRVDQAGEVAANWIYMGQYAVLGREPKTGALLQEMWDQEKKHLSVMNKLQAQHRARPTLLKDVAQIAGFGLGAITALMGPESAMACTEAVETVIGEHYNDQLREMESFPDDHPSVPLLREVIKEFRDDELEHLDIAVENFSQRAPGHAFLSSCIGAVCTIGIELCKRI